MNNYGHLMIDTDAKKRHYGPKLKGDQVYGVLSDTWCDVTPTDLKGEFHSTLTYRRPLVLPDDPEWELVEFGLVETAKAAGVWPCNDWHLTIDGVTWFTQCNGSISDNILAVRRRKQKAVEQSLRWIPLAERLPRADEYPCWVTDGKVVHEAHESYLTKPDAGRPGTPKQSYDWDRTITHFCPNPKQEPPPLPYPPKPSHEIACEQWFSVNERKVNKAVASLEDTKIIWNAALNWRNEQ